MAIPQTVQRFLDRHGVAAELIAHRPSETSGESAAAAQVPEDHLAKAVVLRDARGPLLAVIPADHWLKLHALEAALHRRLALAEEAMAAALFPDCALGAFPAVGAAYELETVLDEALTSLDHVYFEAGDHRHLVRVAGADFLKLLAGARRGFFSHAGAEG